MRTISDNYLGFLRLQHKENKNFGNQSAKWAFSVKEICKKLGTSDVLDYGCGNAKLSHNLSFDIACYDPALKKYEDGRKPSDVVVCTNVLEMVEPEYVQFVLEDIFNLCKKACFFVIATVRSRRCLPDGRNAHLVVNSANWWIAVLTLHFSIEMVNNDQHEVVVLCKPLPRDENKNPDSIVLAHSVNIEDN